MSQPEDKEIYHSYSFPMKLYTMLEDSRRVGFEDVVSWQSDEKSFKVLKPDLFAKEILSRYFNQTKYKSFQRQLNIYGFKRVHSGPDKGGYSHHLFCRRDPELCSHMVRQNVSPKLPKSNSRKKEKEPPMLEEEGPDSQRPITRLNYPGLLNYFNTDNSVGNHSSSLSDISNNEGSVESNRLRTKSASPAKALKFRKRSPLDTLLSVVCNKHLEQSDDQEHSFPWKLHALLDDAERQNFQGIVSWTADGKAFKVHDTSEFVTRIMPNYFDQTKYESFRRQLNLYGFHRVTRGAEKGVISHPFFIKTDRSLCRKITRKQVNGDMLAV